jgi:hypothetical protein
MNRAIRDELLQALARFGDHAPDVRFGQLIANLAFLARSSGASDVWEVEDEELLEAAREHLRDLEERTEALASKTSA